MSCSIVAKPSSIKRAGSERERKRSKKEELKKEEVMWRMDPSESFSDWEIEIEVAGAGTCQSYGVHRNMLALGKRKSNYFARLFRSNFHEQQNAKSQIELNFWAASAFPNILDFIYGAATDRPLEIDTKSATALHFLAEYFEVATLKATVEEFLDQDLTFENVSLYFHHASVFHNEAIRDRLTECLAKNIATIDTSSSLLTELDCDLWVKTLEKVDPAVVPPPTNGQLIQMDAKALSCHKSKLMACICQNSSEAMDLSTFTSLTAQEKKLPFVDPSVAMALCNHEDQLIKDSTSEGPEGLSSLQQRCTTALAETWNQFRNLDEDITKQLKNRKPAFWMDLLSKSTNKAWEELEEAKRKDLETKAFRSGAHARRSIPVHEDSSPPNRRSVAADSDAIRRARAQSLQAQILMHHRQRTTRNARVPIARRSGRRRPPLDSSDSEFPE